MSQHPGVERTRPQVNRNTKFSTIPVARAVSLKINFAIVQGYEPGAIHFEANVGSADFEKRRTGGYAS